MRALLAVLLLVLVCSLAPLPLPSLALVLVLTWLLLDTQELLLLVRVPLADC